MNREGIENIWILTDDGIVIFTTDNQIIDVQLFGGFLTALSQFAERLTRGELKSIDVGVRKFHILKSAHLIFVASTPNSLSENFIIKQLDIIKTRFIESYPLVFFSKWTHNTNHFTSFSNKIDKLSMRLM